METSAIMKAFTVFSFRAATRKQRSHRGRLRYRFFASIPCASAIVCAVIGTSALAQILPSERAVLINLFNTTNGTGWKQNYNWCITACSSSPNVTFNTPGTECTWYGVYCDSTESTVTGLDFYGNNLVGTIPDLSGLNGLQAITFYENRLTGNIPTLSTLTQLQEVDFSWNNLSGTIPDLSALANLQNFEANHNQLAGPFQICRP